MNKTPDTSELDDRLSDLSITADSFYKKMSRIYSSNLDQTYNLISLCSLQNKEFQLKLQELQGKNSLITKENSELKSKLFQLEQVKPQTPLETSTRKNEITHDQSRISTLWPSEINSELSIESKNSQISSKTNRNYSRGLSYSNLPIKKKRALVNSAMIHSVSLLNF